MFSTFLFIAVDNRLRAFASFWKTQKRLPSLQVTLESVDHELQMDFGDLTPDIVVRLVCEGALYG